jgi:hypothetical protein
MTRNRLRLLLAVFLLISWPITRAEPAFAYGTGSAVYYDGASHTDCTNCFIADGFQAWTVGSAPAPRPIGAIVTSPGPAYNQDFIVNDAYEASDGTHYFAEYGVYLAGSGFGLDFSYRASWTHD